MAEFLSSERLVAGGPGEFTRTLERLLPLLGFTQVVNIDGANDQGGDLLAYYGRELVAIQAKWRQDPIRGSVSEDAVNEVSRAIDAYGAASGIVVTNGRFTRTARARIAALGSVGRSVKAWDGAALAKLARGAAELPPQVELRPYQTEAVDKAWEALARTAPDVRSSTSPPGWARPSSRGQWSRGSSNGIPRPACSSRLIPPT